MAIMACGCIYTPMPDRSIDANRCTKHRIERLRDSTSQLAIHCQAEAVRQGEIFRQYWEGAITIAELNMRTASYLVQCNNLAFQLEELYQFEEIARQETR